VTRQGLAQRHNAQPHPAYFRTQGPAVSRFSNHGQVHAHMHVCSSVPSRQPWVSTGRTPTVSWQMLWEYAGNLLGSRLDAADTEVRGLRPCRFGGTAYHLSCGLPTPVCRGCVQQRGSGRTLRRRAYRLCTRAILHAGLPRSNSAWPPSVNCRQCVLAAERAAVPILATWLAAAGRDPHSWLCRQLLHCFAACWLQVAAAASLAVAAAAVCPAADPATAEQRRQQEQGQQPGEPTVSICGM
jgi:hypothetical protein